MFFFQEQPVKQCTEGTQDYAWVLYLFIQIIKFLMSALIGCVDGLHTFQLIDTSTIYFQMKTLQPLDTSTHDI